MHILFIMISIILSEINSILLRDRIGCVTDITQENNIFFRHCNKYTFKKK